MKKVGIIASFEYRGLNSSKQNSTFLDKGSYIKNSLPGAVTDLYLAYTNFKKYCDQVYFYTDIENICPETISYAISAGHVDSDIYYFDETIKKENRDWKNIEQDIKELVENENFVYLYYSGHGIQNNIVLPDESKISFLSLRESVCSGLNKRIFCIFDCCNCDGMKLPFILKENEFRVSKDDFSCVNQKMLVITSSDHNHNAVTCKTGSQFTINFFSYLNELSRNYNISSGVPLTANRNLQRLCNSLPSKISNGITVNIYSSHVIDPVLWNWVGTNENFVIDSEETLTALIVEKY